MHRAALAFAIAGTLAVNLRHHARHVAALGNQVSVAAMGGGNTIGRAQRRAYAYRGRLFADRNVQEAGDLSGGDQVLNLLLEMPDSLHP